MTLDEATLDPVVIAGFEPVLDLAAARKGVASAHQMTARTIDAGWRESGVLVITGHGTDPIAIR